MRGKNSPQVFVEEAVKAFVAAIEMLDAFRYYILPL
jgi:hypothetical protein